MKKIISLLLVLVLMCAMLVSCDNAQELMEKADAALLEEPYSVTMTMSFESENDDLNDILSMMNLEIPMQVDGENIAMKMEMDMMGYSVNADIRVVDKVMYYKMSLLGETLKAKCELSDAEYADFLSENNAQMPIAATEFANMTVEKQGDKTYIACAEISEAGLKELNGVLDDVLSEFSTDAEIENAVYGITLKDGKYESMELSCDYVVTVDGEDYYIYFTVTMDFEYGDVDAIKAPSDAYKYEEISYDDLMG